MRNRKIHKLEINMLGQQFGDWLVIERVGHISEKCRDTYWLCQCSCGTRKKVNGYSLRKGKSITCGCRTADLISEGRKRHGHSTLRDGTTPVYRAWKSMLNRCYNQAIHNYERYGGRGITVCERWHKFENFLTDMGERPANNLSLDRIDNEKGYSKENCRWATAKQQAMNRRPRRSRDALNALKEYGRDRT